MNEKIKRKRHTYTDRVMYIRLLESGYSIRSIHNKFGIDNQLLAVLWEKYQKGGFDSIKPGKNFIADLSLKKKIILDIEQNHLTLCEASLKYGPSASRIRVWLKMYHVYGIEYFNAEKQREILLYMRRQNKSEKSLTEIECLQKENKELKTEIAILKKVQALVEKKKERLLKIGQESSKN